MCSLLSWVPKEACLREWQSTEEHAVGLQLLLPAMSALLPPPLAGVFHTHLLQHLHFHVNFLSVMQIKIFFFLTELDREKDSSPYLAQILQ